MSTLARPDTFPRAPLFGAAALVLLALAAAGLGRFGRAPAVAEIAASAQRDLRFADRDDGAILVYQTGIADPVAVVTGQAGFLRGTLRALARERRLDRLGADAPFRLSAWPDGRLTLDDTATGQRIELEAFGSDNAAVFARLLAAQGTAP
jgi:putative photosynthetic complex assembly protein